jgi:hypothetical protein
MQALSTFISPIPEFEGDIPIPVIPVSVWSLSDESASDPIAGASVGASTRVGKHETPVILTPPKKARKTTGKSTSRIKINEPAPKASSALTHPSCSWKKIMIHRSNRYASS